MSSWLFLVAAILSEVTGTTMMKLSRGFERPLYSVLALLAYGTTLAMMTLALKRLPIGLAYAVWSGLGITLASLVSLAVFREALGPGRLAGIGLVVAGVVLINLQGGRA